MSEIILEDKSIHEPTVAHLHPLETIPQGSQSDGVLNGHDLQDVNIPAVLKVGAVIAGVVVLGCVVSWFTTVGILRSLKSTDSLPSATYVERPNLERAWPFKTPPVELQSPDEAPALQPDPETPVIMLREMHDAKLRSYDWVEDEEGRRAGVSIPVELAMKLTLERGLPVEVRANPEIAAPTGEAASIGSIRPSWIVMAEERAKLRDQAEQNAEADAGDR